MLLTEIYLGNAVDFCNCGVGPVTIQMRTTGGQEVSGFPVKVFNVNQEPIGDAQTKDEYMSIWNANSVNAAVGHLVGAYGPYSFRFINAAGPTPEFVYGNPYEYGDFNNDFSSDFNIQ